MKCNRTGFYKIGKSKNPKHREKTLQSESPSIQMIAVFNGQGWQEKDWHIHFAKCRVRGEWFNLTNIQVAFICHKLKISTTSPTLQEIKKEKVGKSLAEIRKRLTKIVNAETEARESTYESHHGKAFYDQIRKKHKIPQGVFLFGDSGLTSDDMRHFMISARLWFKGEMTNEDFNSFVFHYGEIAEVDYFWVLMNKPAFFYGDAWGNVEDCNSYEKLEAELRKIGTTKTNH